MADVELQNVTKRFGRDTAVDSLSFSVKQGTLAALLGPSGCGKSTTLRMIAGLDDTTSGTIRIGGQDVTGKPPAGRGLSMVFQSYALFPHLTVAENIIFGLRVRKVSKAEIKRRLADATDLLGLGDLLERKPSQLSGGQQQRVALGRAIVAQSAVCLMDEPLSNLDAQLRQEMRREIRALQQRIGMTMLYVTHDQIEAMTMADQVILLRGGKIEQDASPAQLYEKPATEFAAKFVGTPPMNVLPATPFAADLQALGARPPAPIETLQFGVRPEDIAVSESGAIVATITSIDYHGSDSFLDVSANGLHLVVRRPGRTALMPGQAAKLSFEPGRMHWFHGSSGHRIAAS